MIYHQRQIQQKHRRIDMSSDSFTIEIDGKKTEFLLKSPSFKDQREAQKIYNQAFSDAVKSGCIVRGRLNDLLKEQGLWDDQKEMKMNSIQQQLLDHEQTLAKGGISLQRARGVALDMRKSRDDLRELISSRTNLDNNTAEGQADNARFNYLVSACLVYSDSKRAYFANYEAYLNKASDPVALRAAQVLATKLYGLDDNYEKNLPENKFLTSYNFVDNDLRFINKEGKFIDVDGKLVDENGRYINEQGEYVDKEGKLVDDEGDYVVDFAPFLDDDGKPVVVESEKKQNEKTQTADTKSEEKETTEEDSESSK
jgi:hypothetical protein